MSVFSLLTPELIPVLFFFADARLQTADLSGVQVDSVESNKDIN